MTMNSSRSMQSIWIHNFFSNVAPNVYLIVSRVSRHITFLWIIMDNWIIDLVTPSLLSFLHSFSHSWTFFDWFHSVVSCYCTQAIIIKTLYFVWLNTRSNIHVVNWAETVKTTRIIKNEDFVVIPNFQFASKLGIIQLNQNCKSIPF